MNPEVVLSFSWTLSSVFLMWLRPRDKDALWQKSDALEFQQKLSAEAFHLEAFALVDFLVE